MHFGLTIMFQDHCVINLVSLEKQSRPNHVRGYVRIQRFHQDIALCPVEAANCYSNKVDTLMYILYYSTILQVSKLAPERTSFFVSFRKPHGSVTAKTLSRWLLTVMEAAGIDTSQWKAHATRSAASCFRKKTLSCAELLKVADWSSSGNVYQKFYERYI